MTVFHPRRARPPAYSRNNLGGRLYKSYSTHENRIWRCGLRRIIVGFVGLITQVAAPGSLLLSLHYCTSRLHLRFIVASHSLPLSLFYLRLRRLSNMRSHTTFLSVFATLIALAASQQQCFGLNGTPLDNSFAPCNPGAKHSGCCATNRTIGADICLDSGLCMATRGEMAGMIWQSGCTDRTGKDIACPKMCPSSMFQSVLQYVLPS
jgi:hypothetical protein